MFAVVFVDPFMNKMLVSVMSDTRVRYFAVRVL